MGEGLSYSEVMQLLEQAELELQRTVNPTIYTPDEFAKRLAEGQSFFDQGFGRRNDWFIEGNLTEKTLPLLQRTTTI